MKKKVKPYGKYGLHITLKKSEGFKEGEIIDVSKEEQRNLAEFNKEQIMKELIELIDQKIELRLEELKRGY